MKKLKRKKLTRQQTLSILMAAVNGVNSFAPLAAPIAAALTEVPLPRRETVDEVLLTNLRRGGQILDSLLFTTAYAYTNPITGGTVSGETVNGSQTVSNGTVISTTIAGGAQIVLDGTVSATTIVSHGTQTVLGGTVVATTLNGGFQYVSGGTVSATTINSGSLFVSSGTVSATTINQGAQHVYGGTVAATMIAGGAQYVSGGTVAATTIAGGGQFVYGGTVSTTTINNGFQEVFGGTVSATTINGGTQFVYGGTVTDTAINSGGTQTVLGGGTASATTVSSGGTLTLQPGGTAFATTLNSGYVLRAGTSATLMAGSVTISGGTATNVTLNSGGYLTVSGGGTAVATTINSGGTQTVNGGGSASGTTVAGGIQYVSGSISGTTITSDGTQNLYSGATATDTAIYAGAQNVSGGATASVTTINSGGAQNVLSSGTAVATIVYSGGSQYVYSGGTASSTTVSGGIEYVASGGTTTDTTVASGILDLELGAVVSGTTTLSGGTVALVGSGSYVIPALAAAGGTVKLAYGSTVGRNLTINNLSGSAKFVINTDLAAGRADTVTVANTAGASANSLQVAYDPGFATGQNVSGSATFASVTGGATFTAQATEYGAYRYTPTITSATSGTATTWTITQLSTGTGNSGAGASETVRTAADVAGGSLVAWRAENNNLTKRMGELRNATGEAGMWLRTYRGAQDIAGTAGRTTQQQYTALQGGFDHKLASGEGVAYAGWAVGYLEGSSSFTRGSGDASSVSAAAYYSWLGKEGHFLDFIAKVGRLKNSYTSYLNDATNTKVDGSYRNWGTSLSAEYGVRRQLKDNWYVEPQAELTLSRVNGASYTTSDGTSIKNDAVNSFVGRVGVAVGRQARATHYYGKVSLVREFTAKAAITAASGGLSPVDMRQDLKENWLEFALGLTGKLGQRTDGYLELTRTTGDKAKTPWQVNVGARWNF